METQKKTREKSVYLVEYGDKNPGEWNSAGEHEHESSAKAETWIRKNGVNGKRYRVVRVTFGPVTCKTEPTVKRVLE